jgi:ketosteroid isomerase-like protein
MSEHPNAALLREAIGSYMRGEENAGDYYSDDIAWWQIGVDEPIRGKAAIMESMASMPDDVDFDLDIHTVVANDDHAIALVTATVGEGDDAFTYRTAEIYHVEDGKLTERWAFSDDTQRILDFFAQFED